MQIKSFNVEIPEDEPFKNDLLDREKYAKNLTQIVKKFNDGLVMGIDGQWGSGKTTFINMWNKYLMKEKITTLHFNAWENDYQTEVLPALISKLSSLIKDDSPIKSNLLKNAGKALFSIGSAVIDHKLGEGFTKDLTKIGLDQAQKVMEGAIANYEEKKKTFEEFKKALEKFTVSIENKPIVFFIDELDRCKPSYAVEVLELVKHLFSVPGIVFVIATDKQQLANSIRGYYGSDLLDGKGYLERIFDIEYKLPQSDLKKFSNKLFEYYGYKEFYSSTFRMSIGPNHDADDLLHMTIHGFALFNFSLRKQIRILSKTRIILNSYDDGWKTYPGIIILLYILMLDFPELYEALSKHKVSPNKLHNELEKVLPDSEDPGIAQGFNLLMILFIRSYILSYCKRFIDFKYTLNEGKPHAEVKTKFDIEGDNRHKSYTRMYNELFIEKNAEGDLLHLEEYVERVEFLKDIYL